MTGRVRMAALIVSALVVLAALTMIAPWYIGGPLAKPTPFIVPDGSSVSSISRKLEKEGAISSAAGFRLRARLLGHRAPIHAGEFMLPKGASPSRILAILQSDEIIRRFVTVPEGMPSIMVYERLMRAPHLIGTIAVPEEGSILPDTYDYQRDESRAAVVGRMQAAMRKTVAGLWARRAPNLPVATPQQAVILASIVEKETGKPAERPMVAGLYENRLRIGMALQADPTIIYPITQGKPLGRRIKESEIHAVNDYNTYAMAGLPKGPITNPGKASLAAVLNPARTDALYMVADGTGGHVFAATLAQHNANVAKWMAIRRQRGEL